MKKSTAEILQLVIFKKNYLLIIQLNDDLKNWKNISKNQKPVGIDLLVMSMKDIKILIAGEVWCGKELSIISFSPWVSHCQKWFNLYFFKLVRHYFLSGSQA